MKNLNSKTNLPRKAVAIASAVMTLSTVAVLTMVPISQAQAQQADPNNRSEVGFRNPKKTWCTKMGCSDFLMAKGGGRSPDSAKQNAKNAVKCPQDKDKIDQRDRKTAATPMLNNTWWWFDIYFTCKKVR